MKRARSLSKKEGANKRIHATTTCALAHDPDRSTEKIHMKAILSACTILLLNRSFYAEEIMIVAHRGASRDAPENTMPAFKLAWEQGAHAIEGDFHLTKDGHIVCIHDADTKKVSNTNLVVRNATLAELRQLDVSVRHSQAFEATVVPTIAEVFSTIPERKTIYIEIKCGAEIIAPLLKEIKHSGLSNEQIVVISFNRDVIQKLKANAPQYKAYWLCGFKKDQSGEITPPIETVLNTLEEIQADGLSSNTAIPESVVKAVINQGYEWHVWTINDLHTARRMKALGVKSITTDMPGYMRNNLVEQSPTVRATARP